MGAVATQGVAVGDRNEVCLSLWGGIGLGWGVSANADGIDSEEDKGQETGAEHQCDCYCREHEHSKGVEGVSRIVSVDAAGVEAHRTFLPLQMVPVVGFLLVF